MNRTHRARRKRKSRSGDGAAQVVVGVAMAARELGAGKPENFVHLGGSPMLRQQVPGDPPIDDTPVGLGEASADMPSLHASLIDLDGYRRSDAGRDRIFPRRVGVGSRRRRRRCPGPGRLQQRLGLWRQTGLRAHHLHPRSVAARGAPRRFLVGETGEPAQ